MRTPTMAVRLEGNEDTLRLLSNLWCEDHIFPMLDKRIATFYGAHRLFSMIEKGTVRVYGAFDEDGVCGVVFGTLSEDGETWMPHIVFLRDVDACRGCMLIERVLVDDYAKDGVTLRRIDGYIPGFNRAAIVMAKRYGCVDLGEDPNITIVHGRYEIPCHIMRKEL